jgi:hypothetical protein
MIFNVLVTMFFAYVLVTKDYTNSPKWMYYMDGLVFAVNFAIVFKYLTDMIGF